MMLALLLHETSDPHVHAGNSALSLAQVAVVAAVLLAGILLLRAIRRMRAPQPAPERR